MRWKIWDNVRTLDKGKLWCWQDLVIFESWLKDYFGISLQINCTLAHFGRGAPLNRALQVQPLIPVDVCTAEKEGHPLIHASTDVQRFFWEQAVTDDFWPHKTSSGCTPRDLVSWLRRTPSGIFPFLGTLWPKSKDSSACVHAGDHGSRSKLSVKDQ